MNYIDEVKTELSKHIKVGKGLTNYYSLLVLLLGEETTLADVHDAWAVNVNETWDKEKLGEHRSMIPFDELSAEIQAGGSVSCDDVDGDVQAGGSVTCGKVGGDIMAGGSVRHG